MKLRTLSTSDKVAAFMYVMSPVLHSSVNKYIKCFIFENMFKSEDVFEVGVGMVRRVE